MKRNSRIIAFVMAIAMVLTMIPISSFAMKIKLKNCTTKKVMSIGSTFEIVTNQDSSMLTFASSKEKVATVTEEGIVYAKKKGKTTITITSGAHKAKIKVTVKKPLGYSISKKAGFYAGRVGPEVKAKKKYVVYYTTTAKFKASRKIKSKKLKAFSFKKDTTLKLYVSKAKKKLSTKKINKTAKKYSNYNEYFYDIGSVCGGVITPPASSNDPDSTTIPGGTTNPENPTASGAPAPTATPSNQPTPFAGTIDGDDSIADYVAPVVGQFDDTDRNTQADNNAIEITIPTVASGVRTDKEEYAISTKNKLTILAPGTYIIRTESTTTASDALIEVDPVSEGLVHLILDGVNLTSSNNTAPDSDTGLITFKKTTTRAVVTVKDGTVNTLTDTGATGIDKDDNVSTTYTGGINCKKIPLTINGAGALNITTVNGNGIKATNSLKIIDTAIKVSGSGTNPAGHNGITGKTELMLENAKLDVYADGDALKTTLDETDIAADATLSDLGNMDINGGTYKLVSANGDAISVYRTLNLNPTTLEAVTRNEARFTTDSSYKAIKAGTTINVPETAGTIIADTTATELSSGGVNYSDDTLHCDGYIQINGGALELSSADEGIHANKGLLISAGTVNIKQSQNGMEAADASIYGGEVMVNASGDGIVAEHQIIIAGGTVTVTSGVNGIISNGNVRHIGGDVTVNGSPLSIDV